jgi:gluconokinase
MLYQIILESMMTFLILDVGSSSVRAMLFDASAQLIPGAMARRPHQFMAQPEGASTAETAHLQSLIEMCIDEILVHPAAKQIQAVGITTFVSNMMGLDAQGQPITPIYTYADTQSALDAADLKREVDEKAAHQRTGCLIHTAYWPSRLRWIQRTQSTLWPQVHRWLDVATYLFEQWFGHTVPCSYSVAAWTGLLNREGLTWDADWLKTLHLNPDHLPPLADYKEAQQGLADSYGQRWPALRDVPFFLAIGDGAAANVGSGAIESGIAALTVGTTAAVRIVSTEKIPPVPAGLWSYRIDAPHHLIGGATSEGGNIFQWLRETLLLPSEGIIEKTLSAAAPDAHGLTFLPLLAGERSPGWALNATGTVHGIRLSTRPFDIAQAALEGVALRLSTIVQQLDTPLERVMASGAALEKSPAWAQMMSDALAQPIALLAETELAARGMALLLLHAQEKEPLTSRPPQIKHIVQPREQGIEALKQARVRQQDLYARLYA